MIQNEYAIIMKIGPHNGMTIDEIVCSKKREQKAYGKHYWGYSGNLCHPKIVNFHVDESMAKTGRYPKLLLSETKSKFSSSIGKIRSISSNGEFFINIPYLVQLQGASFAFVATELHYIEETLDMDEYVAITANNSRILLTNYLRYHINKACIIRKSNSLISNNYFQNILCIKYIADLIPPFVIWLRGI